VASSDVLILSNCGYRCCFSTYIKLFVSTYSLTKTNIMQSIIGDLNTYKIFKLYSQILFRFFFECLLAPWSAEIVRFSLVLGFVQCRILIDFHLANRIYGQKRLPPFNCCSTVDNVNFFGLLVFDIYLFHYLMFLACRYYVVPAKKES